MNDINPTSRLTDVRWRIDAEGTPYGCSSDGFDDEASESWRGI